MARATAASVRSGREDARVTAGRGNWADLRIRIASAAVMAVIGVAGVWLGGVWFQILVVFAVGVMVWELAMMVDADRPERAMLLAVLTAAVLSGQLITFARWGFALFALVPLIGAVMLPRDRVLFALYALGLQLAGWALVTLRYDSAVLLVWLVLVVIASDVLGYFAGRLLGGPKFWPRVSPKKTWSGTVAGWAGAAVVGAVMVGLGHAGWHIVWVSVIVGFAGQMGDIVESAFKRKMGVKDASDLIPGHGGLMDRFDALMGAALVTLGLLWLLGRAGIGF